MKKICLILALCMILSALTGCGASASKEPEETYPLIPVTPLEGEAETVDTTGMKEYTLKCGLTFFGPSGLKEKETEAMAGYMKSGYHIVMVIREDKAGTILENATAEEYAKLLSDSNGLTPFQYDTYGSLATTYTAKSDEEGNEDFYYYVTVKESEDCFWLIQLVCPVSLSQDGGADKLAQWSATFREAEQKTE